MTPQKPLWRELTITSSIINSRPVAFFDSGVGGLTVYEKLKKLLPNEDCLYFGDTKNMPYGEKTETQLIEYADKIFNFFEEKNVKAVVMACNTTSSVTYDKLKDKYKFKIYPIIQSAASSFAALPVKKIGIMATRATINSGAYEREIKKYNPNMEVYSMACPIWVKIVENNLEDNDESIELIKKDLDKMLENNPEKIILGCTHYPYLLGVLSKLADKDLFLDPAQNFAQIIADDLKHNNMTNPSNIEGFERFYVSSSPENFMNAGRMFYDIKHLPELVTL